MELGITSKSIRRFFIALLLTVVAMMVIFYRGQVFDIYDSIIIKRINVDQNEIQNSRVGNQEEFDCSFWKKLLSEKNMDLMKPYKSNEGERQNLSVRFDEASKRGPHQRVVSFSFYGKINNGRNYFQGIEDNAKLMGKIYPNWIMRLYHDIPPLTPNTSISKIILNTSDGAINTTSPMIQEVYKGLISSPQVKLCTLQHMYPNLDIFYVGNISGYGKLLGSQGNMWRFLAMADPLVDVFVSRDLDSRLNEREKAAVDDWLSSNLTFHIMRDHPFHYDPILAGMWGAVTYREREKLANITKQMMGGGMKYLRKNLDQILLKDILWPQAKGDCKQHDSYFCGQFKGHGHMTPWPTQRLNEAYNFVGSRINTTDIKPMPYQCPERCRPRNHHDWIYC